MKKNIFTDADFYVPYIITTGILALFTWGAADGFTHLWELGVIFLGAFSAIVGLIAWGSIKNRNRAIALGILLGSITPFIFLFIVTGGCGLVTF